jgi:hypothetical protein
MTKEMTPRVIPANHFVAESLEEEADRLPPSESAKAKYLRDTAATFRTLRTTKMVRVWEEKEDVNQAAARITREATKS